MTKDDVNKTLRYELETLIDYTASCKMPEGEDNLNWLNGLCKRLNSACAALASNNRFSTYTRQGHSTIVIRDCTERSKGA